MSRCFLDVSIGERPVGRIVFELFRVCLVQKGFGRAKESEKDTAPLTCENFRCLCTGERGTSSKSQKPLHYKGAPFHRIINEFMIQGGDTTLGNGKGGESIYGGTFEDEDLQRPVDDAGLLVMANRGPATNSSQFFITLAPAPHLTGKHCCFGRVVAGMDTVETLAHLPVDSKDRPVEPVTITHCGELIRKSVAKAPSPSPSESDHSLIVTEVKQRKKTEKRSKKRRRSASPVADPVEAALAREIEVERQRQAKQSKVEALRAREKQERLEASRDGLQVRGSGARRGLRAWDD